MKKGTTMMFRWHKALALLGCVLPATLAGIKVSADYADKAVKAKENHCLGASSLKMSTLIRAAQMYEWENHHFPDANRFETELLPYLPRGFDFTLPKAPYSPQCRIAMNARLSGVSENTDLDCVIFFPSVKTAPNAHDELTSLPTLDDNIETISMKFSRGYGYTYPLREIRGALASKEPQRRVWLLGER